MSRKRKKNSTCGYGDDVYWQSADLNYRQYLHYYYMMQDIMINRYKWLNLPDSIDERFLEMTLFRNGVAVVFKPWFTDKLLGTQVTPSGRWNLYDNPTELTSWGNNGWSYRMGADKGVPIWASRSRKTDHLTVSVYAERLTRYDRIIDVNINAMRTPVLITCPEEKKQSIQSLYQQAQGGEPVIFGFSGLMTDVNVGVFKTDVPNYATELMLNKHRTLNEFYTYAGVNNANQDKKERVVTDEVQANNGQVEISRLVGLNARREACDIINRRYARLLDAPIEVVWNHDNASNNYDFFANDMISNDIEDGEGRL